jgi:hypothetical protein
VHYECHFRTSFGSARQNIEADPGQFHNRASDPAYAPRVLAYAQKMLSWRLHYADRTLTGYSASPEGLLDRRFGTATLVTG